MNHSRLLRDHLAHPRNAGSLDRPDAVGEAEHPACGDMIRLELTFDAERLRAIRFRAKGCPATLALASWLTEHVGGWSREALRGLSQEELLAHWRELPATERHALRLAHRALRSALSHGE